MSIKAPLVRASDRTISLSDRIARQLDLIYSNKQKRPTSYRMLADLKVFELLNSKLEFRTLSYPKFSKTRLPGKL